MSYDFCNLCGTVHEKNKHLPVFSIQEYGYHDTSSMVNATKVRAINMEQACRTYCFRRDANNDFGIANGQTVRLRVWDERGRIKKFDASGELRPFYECREVTAGL